MTIKQKIIKMIYPLIMRTRMKNTRNFNTGKRPPHRSLYDLTITLNTGKELSLGNFRGKKILLVNTASNCGYTPQYEQLQQLYEQYHQQLEIIAFPSNDFKEQEKGSDEDIARFCQVNYGVTFPLVKKSSVLKGPGQHAVFRWLSHASENGWNDAAPSWNFCKFLISGDGTLLEHFESGVSPLSMQITDAITHP